MWGLGYLEKGFEKGYPVPFTKFARRKGYQNWKSRGFQGRPGGPRSPSFSRFGRQQGWWGREGAFLARGVEPGVARVFEDAGLLGIRSARNQVASTLGREAASNAAARFLVSRAAGLTLGLMNLQFAWILGEAAVGTYKAASSMITKYRGIELGGYFPDSQGAYTSRQRAVQAITSSQLQARSAIGNEAQLFHR
jgi:hypothetical protein